MVNSVLCHIKHWLGIILLRYVFYNAPFGITVLLILWLHLNIVYVVDLWAGSAGFGGEICN